MTSKLGLSGLEQKTIQAVVSAGDYAASVSQSFGSIRYKSLKNPQTDADVHTEEMLIDSLGKLFPEAGLITEEHECKKARQYNWAIDPIDGTKFYSTFFPVFFCQVALLDGIDPIISVIYNPISKQVFHAAKDKGAYLNGERISLTYDGPLSQAIVNIEVGGMNNNKHKQDVVTKLAHATHRLTVVSTLLRPYLLTNTVQAHMRYYGEDFIYDLTPMELLIKEAGGTYHVHPYKGINFHIGAHPKTVKEIECLFQF